nr:sensory neuron membrane protein 1-like [Aedes albopictus]
MNHPALDVIKKKITKMKLDNVNFKKMAIICACTLVGGIVFSFGMFPALLKFMIKQVSENLVGQYYNFLQQSSTITTHTIQTVRTTVKKMCAQKSRKEFLRQCRRQGVRPAHIQNTFRCTHSLLEDASPYRGKLEKAMELFTRTLLNTEIKDSFYKMQRLERDKKNGTDAGRWVVYRGVKNIMDLGRVVSYNDETEMDIYDGDECNRFIGTDSTIFPPFLTTKDKLWAWSPEICRSIGAEYGGKSKYAGLPMSFFKLDFGDARNEPEHHCYCRDPPEICPPKGTIDLAPCLGAPIIGSKPHFYDADPKLGAAVDGLTPNEKDHDVYIHFQLVRGTPVSAAKRLMFSMEIEPIRDHPVLGDLPTVILPLFWAEEGASLNKTWTNQLKYTLFLGLRFNAAVKWLTIIIGTIGTIVGGFMHYKRTTKMVNVTPVQSVNGSEKGKGAGMMVVGHSPDGKGGSVTTPVIPTAKELLNGNNGRNLPTVIEGMDKPQKVTVTEMQQERY